MFVVTTALEETRNEYIRNNNIISILGALGSVHFDEFEICKWRIEDNKQQRSFQDSNI